MLPPPLKPEIEVLEPHALRDRLCELAQQIVRHASVSQATP
jgi:hypothetical protein